MDYEALEKAEWPNYKEKLEEAKELYKTANADQRYALELLFPELKDDEDDRIRKELIEALKQLDLEKSPVDTYHYLEWAAWLEKQGEENKIKLLHTEHEKRRANVIAEMKSSWSEEDDKMLNAAIGAVSAADYYTYDDKQDIEHWLKILKQRMGG